MKRVGKLFTAILALSLSISALTFEVNVKALDSKAIVNTNYKQEYAIKNNDAINKA